MKILINVVNSLYIASIIIGIASTIFMILIKEINKKSNKSKKNNYEYNKVTLSFGYYGGKRNKLVEPVEVKYTHKIKSDEYKERKYSLSEEIEVGLWSQAEYRKITS